MAQKKLPSVILRAGEDRRVRDGHPWVFSNEILMDADAKAIPPGSLATLRAPSGEALGLVTFNPHSLIAARLLSTNPEAMVDALFLGRRLAQATALRDRLVGVPYYRLIHAEADGLPGVIVDRFGDALVVQVNTAGMELLTPVLLEALEAELSPKTIVLKNDSPVRELEGPDARDRRWPKAMPSSRSSWSRTTRSSSPTCRGARRPAGSTTSATTGASWRASRKTPTCSTSTATPAASACWRRRAARSR